MQSSEKYRASKRITLIGAAVNILLGVAKCVLGILGNSHALIADGLHSLSDLFTDALVLIAARFGARSADSDHPYGHGRIETAATLFLAMLLGLVGFGIAYDAIEHVLTEPMVAPSYYVVLIILISIFAKEILFHMTRVVARRVDSSLLDANAWHHRSDALSSLIVLMGVVGALMGYAYWDAIAAVIVGGLIIKMGWQLGWSSMCELVDVGVDPTMAAQIKAEIKNISGVKALHQLRSRSMSGKVFIDVHVQVESDLSVSEGHHIAQRVHHELVKKFEAITDVTVHIDPEDDEVAAPSLHLPTREKIVPIIMNALPKNVIQAVGLDYLDGHVYATVTLPIDVLPHHEQYQTKLAQAIAPYEWLEKIRLVYNKEF